MPKITLPDGSSRQYDAPTTAAQVAADIGPGLAKAALGAKVDGQLCDLSTTLDRDCALALVTPKSRDGQVDADALSMLRHSCAHIMAEAIAKLFPGTMLVYGPSLESGFYYDMAFPSGRAPSTDDFAAIESEMAKIIAENRTFTRSDLSLDAGLALLMK